MKHYPEELKLTLIKKYLSQPHCSISSITKEAGTRKSALHDWLRSYYDDNNVLPPAAWWDGLWLDAYKL